LQATSIIPFHAENRSKTKRNIFALDTPLLPTGRASFDRGYGDNALPWLCRAFLSCPGISSSFGRFFAGLPLVPVSIPTPDEIDRHEVSFLSI
jgi:hypothetical protein